METFVRLVQSDLVQARVDDPIRSESSLFLVGKNSRGHWVVRNQSGRCGGLFVGRAEAIKFALSQNGNRPEAVIATAGTLELDMAGSRRRQSRQGAGADARRHVA
jgi:hypothetical protein